MIKVINIMGVLNGRQSKGDDYSSFLLKACNELSSAEYSLLNQIVKEYFYLKDVTSSDKINELRSNYNLNTRKSNPISKETAKHKLKRLKEWIKVLQANTVFQRKKKKELTYQAHSPFKFVPNEQNSQSQGTLGANYLIFNLNKSKDFTSEQGKDSSIANGSVRHSAIAFSAKNTIVDNESNDNDENSGVQTDSDMAIYTNDFIESAVVNWKKANEKDFKQKMVEGIPKGFIIPCWLALNNIPSSRSQTVYSHYSSQSISEEVNAAIIRDIGRTFPKSEYSHLRINYKDILYRVLKAYASLDTSISYCQGMNFIVGFLLITTNFNEREAFYLMIALFSETFKDNPYSIRGFYTEGFPLLLYYRYLFSKSFEELMPKLCKHFASLEIPLDIWANRWIQTLFTIILPVDWCCWVWDCVFFYGTAFIIKFALVLSQVIEKDLLDLNEESEVLKYFNELQQFPLSADSENLAQKSSIDVLIHKAIKLNIMSSFTKEKYIKEVEKDFDCILKQNRKAFDLSVPPQLTQPIKLSSVTVLNSPKEVEASTLVNCQVNVINESDKTESDDILLNRAHRKSLTRTRLKQQIPLDDVTENYDEDMEEEGDNVLSTEIDLKKSVMTTSNKIVKKLQKYQFDFSMSKSELDGAKEEKVKAQHKKHSSHNMFNYNKKAMMNNNSNLHK